ncbi:DUF6300 family protein [Streptomyces pilosus]|uniref:DUF6300 family protein n=1 Tax=Streptomyces pilosus TaxID=28893 RepID=UPI0036338C55
MAILEFSEAIPPCTRCDGQLIMSAQAPQTDRHGQPIRLELCPACDTGNTDRPAAGLLLQFLANGGGQDLSRAQEAGHLITEWTKECMAAHGWYLEDAPPDHP